ncbi:hypothetical protein AB0Q95_29780 [Streptomyces sp. NPDC059900]
MSRWERWRARRPVRSRIAETAITTILVALLTVTFAALLHTVLTNS